MDNSYRCPPDLHLLGRLRGAFRESGAPPGRRSCAGSPFSPVFSRPQRGRGPVFARDCGRARSLPARRLPTNSRHLPSRRGSSPALRKGCAGAARAEPRPSCRPAPPGYRGGKRGNSDAEATAQQLPPLSLPEARTGAGDVELIVGEQVAVM